MNFYTFVALLAYVNISTSQQWTWTNHDPRIQSNSLSSNRSQRQLTPAPTLASIEATGTFAGIRPVHYTLDVQLPLQSDTTFNGAQSISQKMAFCTSTMTFQVIMPTRTIFVNTRNMDIDRLNVKVTSTTQKTPIPLDESAEVYIINDPNSGMMVVTMRDELARGTYTLHTNSYKTGIGGAWGTGLWSTLATSQLTNHELAYSTQMQLDHAREVYPSIDHPRFKATYDITITYPPHYKALSASEALSTTKTPEGWQKTQFATTPKLAAYVVGFTLLPPSFATEQETAFDGVILRLHYNAPTTNVVFAKQIIGYIKHAYERLSVTFNAFKLPVTAIDHIMLPRFTNQGMENWGMVVLSEHYLAKIGNAYQLSLIAHELTHMWIGNMVGVDVWRYLCLQEGITDYYARRVVEDYFGKDSKEFTEYMVDKWQFSMRHETDSTKAPISLVVSDTPKGPEVAGQCYGKVVFLMQSLERLVGGRRQFDSRLNEMLRDHQFGHMNVATFAALFDRDTLKEGNALALPLGRTITAAHYFLQWFNNKGTPTLTIRRVPRNTSQVLITQAGIYRTGQGQYGVSQGFAWPLTLTMKQEGEQFLHTLILQNEKNMVSLSRELNRSEPLLVNVDGGEFTRVNYELIDWQRHADRLLANPRQYTVIERIRLVGDFCYFTASGLLSNSARQRSTIVQAVREHQDEFPLSEAYVSYC